MLQKNYECKSCPYTDCSTEHVAHLLGIWEVIQFSSLTASKLKTLKFIPIHAMLDALHYKYEWREYLGPKHALLITLHSKGREIKGINRQYCHRQIN